MMNQLKMIEAKINAMVVRERILIVVTVLALMSYVWWASFAQQNFDQVGIATKNVITKQQTVDNLQQTLDTLTASFNNGIKNEKKIRLTQLKLEIEILEKELRLKTLDLIDPDEMFKVLSGLLNKQSKLTLLSLRRIAVKPAIEAPEAVTEDNAAVEVKSPVAEGDKVTIYRHVMQVSLLGEFSDITQYLLHLENLDWQLIWDSMSLQTNEKGKLVVTIQLSTLSNKLKWVGI